MAPPLEWGTIPHYRATRQLFASTGLRPDGSENVECPFFVAFATQGGAKFALGPDGKAESECGGILKLPGSPLSISAANVN